MCCCAFLDVRSSASLRPPTQRSQSKGCQGFAHANNISKPNSSLEFILSEQGTLLRTFGTMPVPSEGSNKKTEDEKQSSSSSATEKPSQAAPASGATSTSKLDQLRARTRTLRMSGSEHIARTRERFGKSPLATQVSNSQPPSSTRAQQIRPQQLFDESCSFLEIDLNFTNVPIF